MSFSQDGIGFVKRASVHPHANKEHSFLQHFSQLFIFSHPKAFSSLYSSVIAGTNSTFQFLSAALLELANCKIFGYGKRLWLSPCYQ